jgi:hypothetical protein
MSSTNRGGMRSDADVYPTPAWAVTRLLEAVELPTGAWLEPCAGDGAIMRAVHERLPSVAWTANEIRPDCEDLIRPVAEGRVQIGDYLNASFDRTFSVVLTNPPFRLAEEFITKSLAIADHVVMLLRLNYLGSEKRSRFLRENMPDVYVLPNRPSFMGTGQTDSIEYAWFHWKTATPKLDGKIQILAPTSKSDRVIQRVLP